MIKNEEESQSNKVETSIKQRIFVIREHKVMLDEDISSFYQMETKVLLQAIKRNLSRFTEDLMFQLTKEEDEALRSQIVTSKKGRGGRRYLPYVFTDYGVAMLSSVLNSETAIQMNILIIRVFIKIKELILSNKDLEIRVGEVEKKQKEQGNLLASVHYVVKHLIEKPENPKEKVGISPVNWSQFVTSYSILHY